LVARTMWGHRMKTPAAALMAAGVGCWLAADLAYSLVDSADSLSLWLDTGWLAGAVLLAMATWQPLAVHVPVADGDDMREPVGLGRIAVAMVPLVVPGAVEVVGWLLGRDPNPVPLFAVTVVLVSLAFLRAARLLRSESEATARVGSQARFSAAVAANSADAVVMLDSEARICGDASKLAALVGHAGLDTRGIDAFVLLSASSRVDARHMFEQVLRRPGETRESEFEVRHRDGTPRWIMCRVVNLLHDPDVGHVVVNMSDITARKKAENELAHQAFHDGLTGLANRTLFCDRVTQSLRRNARTGLDPAVLFLDLDDFKTVNDSLGHGAGDDLLGQVAERLLAVVRPWDTVARLGGDEFAILIEPSNRPVDEAAAIAERALKSLAVPVSLDGNFVTVTASIGIAVGGAESTAMSMLSDADVAMYRAKTSGKSQWALHQPEMSEAAAQRLRLESDLITALESGQMRLAYQPIIELETERTVGFEALLRWEHPVRGNVPPDTFIPLAEQNGLILPIGRWVLLEACRTAAGWQHDHPDLDLSISVNVSARQITSGSVLSDVTEALASSGLDPSRLVLELTETALIQDTALAAMRLAELSGLGIRLAVDDFGTGYSSLSYLRQFSVDILKIDRSFIESISDDDTKQMPAMVQGLLDLGRTLNLEIVAEGIETDVQFRRLREEHCRFAQGFLFSRPLEVEDLEEHLRQAGLKITPVPLS
jgi:diguanylate cyclase (GGDEF)-like protein/PAS domain S-box-containing protein